MSIAVGTDGLRLTTENRPLPGAMSTAIAAAGPVSVSASGSTTGGAVPLEATISTNRTGYWGYAIKAAPLNTQPTLANGAVVEGFTGVTAGSPVFVADDGTLTHTEPTGLESKAEQVKSLADLSATTALNIVVPAGATKVKSVKIGVKTAITANDTNYWTFSLLNKGAAGNGTTAILGAVDANTTKATGGSGLTAYVARTLTLTVTAADLLVTAGHILEFAATKTASGANLVELVVEVTFEVAQAGGVEPIGVGVTTTKIYFNAK